MKTAFFDYHLPDAAIAARPCGDRDASRLLVVERSSARDAMFRDWASLVPEGALVVLNDTRVIKARLLGVRRGTGGRVELLLTQRLRNGDSTPSAMSWLALGRASKPLRPGTLIDVEELSIEVLARDPDGTLRVRLTANDGVERALETHGHVPLPPYLCRPDDELDAERYQTVFARHHGSIAAPTAGLHLTSDTFARLSERGIEVAFATLHVGVGTFRPVSADDLDEHAMHEEELVVGPELVAAVSRARDRCTKVVAVGTTVVRALESAREPGNPRYVREFSGTTGLLIQPGYSFGPVDALLTNFHLPRSTLVALVAAFAGRERVLEAYRAALDAGYRFLSYGDAMWIPERLS